GLVHPHRGALARLAAVHLGRRLRRHHAGRAAIDGDLEREVVAVDQPAAEVARDDPRRAPRPPRAQQPQRARRTRPVDGAALGIAAHHHRGDLAHVPPIHDIEPAVARGATNLPRSGHRRTPPRATSRVMIAPSSASGGLTGITAMQNTVPAGGIAATRSTPRTRSADRGSMPRVGTLYL